MKKLITTILLSVPVILLPGWHLSAETSSIGGDVYMSDADSALTINSPRDVFIAGFSTRISGDVAQDAHAAGFTVDVEGDVGGNIYAAGANVTVNGPVREDLTISGFTVHLGSSASVGGNARIAAGTITIDAPIQGSLVATAGTIKLNTALGGDVQLSSADIIFGENASVAGSLTYSAPEKIDIPTSVVAAGRVTYKPLSGSNVFRDMKQNVDDSLPQFWPAFVGRVSVLLLLLLFLLTLAAIFLAFASDSVERLRQRASDHAWRSLLYGFIGLSTLVGAIPVSAISLVGIPLIPFVVLALLLLWTLGYMLGVYVVASRVWRAFDGSMDSTLAKLLLLGAGFIGIAILNFIPILGWLINLGLLFFGLGAMTFTIMERLVNRQTLHQAESATAITTTIDESS